MTRPDNPYFARAAVNRMWHYFFGIGLVDPVDGFGADDNPPSHPELLDELARAFVGPQVRPEVPDPGDRRQRRRTSGRAGRRTRRRPTRGCSPGCRCAG